MTRKRLSIATIGCRSNQADSAALARLFSGYDVEIIGEFSESDVVVINTCCVTKEAERDCRKTARRALCDAPDARVLVMGCAVTGVRDFGADLGDRVEFVRGTDMSAEALAERLGLEPRTVEPAQGALPGQLGRTRALIKVQNGCSHFCSYCIVPKARGPEQSMPADAALLEMEALLERGYREIVITGVQLGAWGVDLREKPRLASLVAEMAANVAPGRIRLSSIEPWSVTETLVEVVAQNDRICPHLHLPLQSGDDQILEAMRRGYTSARYLEIVQQVKQAIPDVALGTDVIFGFPGEDDAAFSNTMETLAAIEPAYIHAFTYSPRPETRAAKLPNRPEKAVAKERTRKARAAGDAFSAAYREKQKGRIREVLVEEQRGDALHGLTDNFIPVSLDNRAQPGELISCRLHGPVQGKNRVTAKLD